MEWKVFFKKNLVPVSMGFCVLKCEIKYAWKELRSVCGGEGVAEQVDQWLSGVESIRTCVPACTSLCVREKRKFPRWENKRESAL